MARRIKLVGPRGKKIRVTSPMSEQIDPAEVAKALGAEIVESLPFDPTEPSCAHIRHQRAVFLGKCWANEALETLEKKIKET